MWSDFAGAEAPVWALKEMGVQFDQVECCEWDWGAQKFIFKNLDPPNFTENIFERNHTERSRPLLLSGGFPCKAFSKLRAGRTQLLEDKEAQSFWEEIDTLKALSMKMLIHFSSWTCPWHVGPVFHSDVSKCMT